MPYISRINTQGVCVYASRTLLFLRSDDTLKPIAIELSSIDSNDGNEISRVFVPSSQGTEAALWHLAKAHVAANDSVYHHLISHWSVEQFCASKFNSSYLYVCLPNNVQMYS